MINILLLYFQDKKVGLDSSSHDGGTVFIIILELKAKI